MITRRYFSTKINTNIDYYKILKIPKTATSDEIKQSYYKLAKQLHPDLQIPGTVTTEQFKQVTSAYDILGNQ
jgi:DnaJ-class molecular chaperone